MLENERVRVLDVLFKPGEKEALHSHPDHVICVLEGGKMKVTSSGKATVIDMKNGQALFLNAQSHEAENIGKTEVHLLVVELK